MYVITIRAHKNYYVINVLGSKLHIRLRLSMCAVQMSYYAVEPQIALFRKI